MRRFVLPVGLIALSFAGCTSAPNSPNITLSTTKLPEEYAKCVFPKWQMENSSTTMTASKGRYKIVVKSKVMADDILEVYKTSQGSEVAMYQRIPLASAVGRRALVQAAHDCL